MVAAILATGCGGGELPACPAGEAVEVDLDAWHQEIDDAAVARATGAAIYDPLLARIGLSPLPDSSEDAPSPEAAAMKPASIKIQALRPGDDEPLDWLVAVRFRNTAGAEAMRAQLLRPVPGRKHLYCPLGDDLSGDTEPLEKPCFEPYEGPARALDLESLVTPNRDAIVVRDAGGWCGPGARRGDRLTTSFWGVEDGRLVRYLEAVTFEAWYESPQPPGEIRRAEIGLSDGWPREITLTETVECLELAETTPADGDCRPLERTRTYRYTAGRYAAVDEPSPAPSTGGNQETRP
jgi:hypothetical protein